MATWWFVRTSPSGAAVHEPDAGEADVVEPGLCRDEAVAVLEKLHGQVVQGPHPFLATDRGGGQGEDEGQGEKAENEADAIFMGHRLPP